ncbi:MAG TPA: hypothetical protein VGN35_11120 [Jatrophihabitantaceae bacterium]|jgi:hypothetical protein|nr:hypothetical protein [Jatrophihabitantaceae bacterium]
MREYGPGRPLVFNHIPKTAGSTITAALEQILQPAVFVRGLDRALVGGYDDLDAVKPSARTPFFMSPQDMPADATMVAGHIAPGTTMPRYPLGDHITLLRAPHTRLISQWLHGRSVSEFSLRHWGPSAEAFRVARLPLSNYLQHAMLAPNVDNTITRFLVWPHPALSPTSFIEERDDDDIFTAAIERLDAFAHVDVVENPDFMAALGGWLGQELPHSRLNERTSVPPRMRPDLAAELRGGTREALEHRLRIDNRVWAHIARRVMPDTDVEQVREAALQKTIDRYAGMLTEPSGPITLRRVVERTYEIGVRFDPRRRSVRH